MLRQEKLKPPGRTFAALENLVSRQPATSMRNNSGSRFLVTVQAGRYFSASKDILRIGPEGIQGHEAGLEEGNQPPASRRG